MDRSGTLDLKSEGEDPQPWSGKRVLITGGAGFIALHLAHQLLAEGATVTLLDRQVPEQLPPGINAVQGSVLDAQTLTKAAAGCDVVYHLAAELGVEKILSMPRQVLEVNIWGTVQALHAAQQVGAARFVLASSSEVYGEGDGRSLREQDVLRPVSVYGLSKIMAEVLCRRAHGEVLVGTPDFSRLDASSVAEAQALIDAHRPTSHARPPLEVAVVRLFNVYGPGQREEFVVPRFVSRVVQGLPPVIYGDGQQVRVYTHVGDVARGLSRVGWHPAAAGEVFNLGGVEPTSLRALAQAVTSLSRRPLHPLFQPLGEGIRPHSREIFHRVPNSAHLLERLNFQAATSLADGLRQFHTSYLLALQPRMVRSALRSTLGGHL